MKCKVIVIKTPKHTQTSHKNTNTRRKNKHRDYKENYVWKEDHITRISDNQQKKKICWILDFVVLADHKVKFLKSEKRDKYLDFAREQNKKQKLWNMKMMMISIVIDVIGTMPQKLVKGQEDLKCRGHVETIKTIVLLRLMLVWKTLKEEVVVVEVISKRRRGGKRDFVFALVPIIIIPQGR